MVREVSWWEAQVRTWLFNFWSIMLSSELESQRGQKPCREGPEESLKDSKGQKGGHRDPAGEQRQGAETPWPGDGHREERWLGSLMAWGLGPDHSLQKVKILIGGSH